LRHVFPAAKPIGSGRRAATALRCGRWPARHVSQTGRKADWPHGAAGGSMQRSNARKVQLDNSFRRSSLRPAGRPQISRSASATRVP